MSKTVDVGFIHLHGPLFFAKKNWKEKIDVRIDKGPLGGKVEMQYDRDTQELTIRCDGHEAFIPSTTLFSYSAVTKDPAPKTHSGASANPNVNAQVSGPHDHVFAGLGAGQTGAGKKVK